MKRNTSEHKVPVTALITIGLCSVMLFGCASTPESDHQSSLSDQILLKKAEARIQRFDQRNSVARRLSGNGQ